MDAKVDDLYSSSFVPNPAQMEQLLRVLMRGINNMYLGAVGGVPVIGHGPFKGMEIPKPEEESWSDGNFSTKMLGCYEFELHEALAYAISRNPRTIVNVGCADGYYAIGLARLLSEATVWAYDIHQASVDTCREFANRNGVGLRVHAFLGCKSPEYLQLNVDGHRLYVIDVEADETMLVDLEACPDLKTSDIIVECHDFVNANISKTLYDRLAKTHAVEIVKARLPLFARFDFLNQTPGITQVLFVTEKRPMPTLWLACWANQRGD